MDMLYCKKTAQVVYAGFVREEIANYLRACLHGGMVPWLARLPG